MKKGEAGFTVLELLIAIIAIFGSIGYITNIYKLFQMSMSPITAEWTFRCIGIVAPPVGAIMGFF